MSLEIEIPGRKALSLTDLLLDQNGTLSNRGELLPDVKDLLEELREHLRIHILSADTFGTLTEVASEIGVSGHLVKTGQDKLWFLMSLEPGACAAIGNGTNDEAMLREAGLGIAVLGPEGTSMRALMAADAVCASVQDALALLIEPRLLVATLRA